MLADALSYKLFPYTIYSRGHCGGKFVDGFPREEGGFLVPSRQACLWVCLRS